jgi:hypothetical protein
MRRAFLARKDAPSCTAYGDRAKEALPLRVLRSAAYRTRLLLPVRPYVRLWAWVTRDLYGPAEAFERTPAPFLGLALARALVGLPVVYLLFRPIFPVCAGRLLAEHDPREADVEDEHAEEGEHRHPHEERVPKRALADAPGRGEHDGDDGRAHPREDPSDGREIAVGA